MPLRKRTTKAVNPVRVAYDDWSLSKDAAKRATNEANQKATVLRKAVVEYLSTVKGANVYDEIAINDDELVASRPTVTEVIDPREWVRMWQAGEISDNQFYESLDVSVTRVRQAIGDDQLGDVKIQVLGDTTDIRVIKQDKDNPVEYLSIKPFEYYGLVTKNEALAKRHEAAKTEFAMPEHDPKAIIRRKVKKRNK